LAGRGANETEKLKNDYDEDPDSYSSGAKRFEFKSDIYGAKSVKNELLKIQHGKCVFCESKFTHIAYGDVEHFRPKAGYRQKDSDDLGRPGYYWLAYDWNNLFASCQICNQRFKKNLFPLKVQMKRARSHHNDIGREEAFIIDPVQDNPESFIEFKEEFVIPKRRSRKGRVTIEAMGLDRPEMDEARRDVFQPLKFLRQNLEALRLELVTSSRPSELINLIQEIEEHLDRCVKEEAEYSSMAKCLLKEQ
jgi:uncharacterized protein (TIGR02646 family)